jgi:hypothetical protein
MISRQFLCALVEVKSAGPDFSATISLGRHATQT